MVTMSPFVYWSVWVLLIIGMFICTVVLFYAISRFVNHCLHIFHRWTDWEEYQNDFGWGGKGENGNEFRFRGIEMRKQRVCVVCKKVQDKLVERLYL